MARASRAVRKLRRIKRERTLAYRMVNLALDQRDQARGMFNGLIKQLGEAQKQLEAEAPVPPVESNPVNIEDYVDAVIELREPDAIDNVPPYREDQ